MLLQLVYVFSLLCILQETYCQSSTKNGPRFFTQPTDTFIIEAGLPNVTLDCFAIGNPQPTYEWFKLTSDNQSYSLNGYYRYSVNFGSLIIENPTTYYDAGTYQCRASNIYGTILSTPAQLAILELAEFSNVQPSSYYGLQYYGVEMFCPYVYFTYNNTVLSYRWYKDSLTNEINPDNEDKKFISANGKLYISEVSQQDEGKYYCQVTISTRMLDGNIIGQIPVRTSLPSDLKFISFNPSSTLPISPPEGFLYVVPSTPLNGTHSMRVECFANGPGVLYYTWSRDENKPMPANSRFESRNRTLVIEKVGLDDGGLYSCTIYSTTSGQSYVNSRYITIESKPYFTTQLTSTDLEPGSRLTWYCEADGIPEPTYTWYKNGVELKSSSRMSVDMKTLTIYYVNGQEDNGMYQCEARNIHGSVYSTAQLQILGDDGCVGCSRSDINYGSWKLFSMTLAMMLLLVI